MQNGQPCTVLYSDRNPPTPIPAQTPQEKVLEAPRMVTCLLYPFPLMPPLPFQLRTIKSIALLSCYCCCFESILICAIIFTWFDIKQLQEKQEHVCKIMPFMLGHKCSLNSGKATFRHTRSLHIFFVFDFIVPARNVYCRLTPERMKWMKYVSSGQILSLDTHTESEVTFDLERALRGQTVFNALFKNVRQDSYHCFSATLHFFFWIMSEWMLRCLKKIETSCLL